MTAYCPSHLQSEATATCPRCGKFVCPECLASSAGAALCRECRGRLESEPLDQAIQWLARRIGVLRLVVGIGSAVLGVTSTLLFVTFVAGGRIGALIGALIAVVIVIGGRFLLASLLGVLGPRWVGQAKVEFGLHDEVLEELRVLVR